MKTGVRGRRAPHRRAVARAGDVQLDRLADGRLIARNNGEEHVITIERCFPWTEPGSFLSLRDGDGEEIALIADPADLDDGSRTALGQACREADFMFRVTAVIDIHEEVELRVWRVETEQGERCLQTRLDDWPRRLPDGGLLVRDVTGDVYRLDDLDSMDRRSRKLLWALVD